MTCSAVPLPLDRCRFAVVDVEATGSAPPGGGGRLLEVAVAMLEGGTVHLAYDALLDPGVPVPAAVARLTGITNQMVAGCPRFADVAPRLGRMLEDAIFVAHNARFDWRWLARECAAAGVPAPQGAPLCTIRLTRRLVPELRHRRLDQVAAFFGVENPARHRAFGDALATAYILRALLGRAAERGVETLEQLRELHNVSRHKLQTRRPPIASAIRHPPSAIPS
jgi:DNA polymerase III subunit epsilon